MRPFAAALGGGGVVDINIFLNILILSVTQSELNIATHGVSTSESFCISSD